MFRGGKSQRLGTTRRLGGHCLLVEARQDVIGAAGLSIHRNSSGESLMLPLTLAQASTIVDAALKAGREHKFMPLSVAVLDAGGHLVAFKREDKSGILRFDIAFGTAWGALGMGLGSRTLAGRAPKQPAFFTALAAVSDGRLVPGPAGVLIRDKDGDVIGAVGISGDTADNDEICAIAGVQAAGLTPDPGKEPT
jgi:uncharacterized protein GlcG (DUF336 family)